MRAELEFGKKEIRAALERRKPLLASYGQSYLDRHPFVDHRGYQQLTSVHIDHVTTKGQAYAIALEGVGITRPKVWIVDIFDFSRRDANTPIFHHDNNLVYRCSQRYPYGIVVGILARIHNDVGKGQVQ